jgi:hypothetical protein
MAVYVQPARRWTFRLVGIVSLAFGLLMAAAGEWFVGLVIGAFGGMSLLIGRTEVVTASDGVHVRNPFRRRFIPWADILGVRFGRLPSLALRDGRRIGLEGVEPFPRKFATERSKRVLREFVAAVEAHT